VVEQVNEFKYLRAWIKNDGRCGTEITMAKDAFSKRKELLTKTMSAAIKKKIVKALIYSVKLRKHAH